MDNGFMCIYCNENYTCIQLKIIYYPENIIK